MREDVLVRLKGVQSFRDAGRAGEEPVEILTAGTYRPENGSHVVLWEELPSIDWVAMGRYLYLARFDTYEEVQDFIAFVKA